MSRCLRMKDKQPVKTFVHECLILAALEHGHARTVAA